jgi:hypothetical protein
MEWKHIVDKYEVSDTGLVRSGGNLILKTRLDRYGYEIVTLWVLGKCLTRKVHRLVAEAFLPNPERKPTVNHLDGVKHHNAAINLQWTTVAENHKHGFETGLHTVGENRAAGRPVKLTDKDIPEIRELILKGYGNTEIGRKFGVSCGCIYSIRVGKSWTHV